MGYNKYGNKKTVTDNIKFDSRAEAERYKELKFLEKAGVIKNLCLQPQFMLQEGFTYKGKAYRRMEYIADFKYLDVETGETVVEDVKGVETEVFKLKMKLFLHRYGKEYQFKIVR